jgi:hypothetical protein
VTPGNLELLQVVTTYVVLPPAVAATLIVDERRLRGEELSRAWPASSRNAAILGVFLGLPAVCVLVHFVRTRRGFAGFDLGLLWLGAIVAVDYGAQLGVAAAVDWLGL